MTVGSTRDLVEAAFAGRYSIAAFNIFDDFSLRGVLAAAEDMEAPVIVQVSVKTVRSIGVRCLRDLFVARAAAAGVPASLHLDHCPDRAVIDEALRAGFESVLFDASALAYEEALEQTAAVVDAARQYGAAVESEIEGIAGVEDDVGGDEEGERYPIERLAAFIEATGVDLFAPAIGTAHGRYAAAPRLSPERVTSLVEATGVPQVLHGGTGLAEPDFRDLARRGCAKTNVSTAVKEAYLRAGWRHLSEAHERQRWDPPAFFHDAQDAVAAVARAHIAMLGSAGRAR